MDELTGFHIYAIEINSKGWIRFMQYSTRKEKEIIQKKLLDWYKIHHRKLPWRKTKDPYHIWVSEVMLQQTQVQTVISYYDRFLSRFPDIPSLAQSDIQDVLKLWEGLGYYARVRHLHGAARIIMSTFNGSIPTTWKQFRILPGVGDYIASAVLSIAFNQPYAVVDGNVKRVLARIYELDVPINQHCSQKILQSTANDLLDVNAPGLFNQAMMELGAMVCKSSDPKCMICPIDQFCQANCHKTVDQYPHRVKRKPVPVYHVAAGLVFKDGNFLITQRNPDGLLGGLWEIPGGKVKENETPQEACIRELFEETSLHIRVIEHIAQVKHAYTHFKIIMDVFRCEYVAGEIRLDGPVDYRWIQMEHINEYPFSKADIKCFEMIKNCK